MTIYLDNPQNSTQILGSLMQKAEEHPVIATITTIALAALTGYRLLICYCNSQAQKRQIDAQREKDARNVAFVSALRDPTKTSAQVLALLPADATKGDLAGIFTTAASRTDGVPIIKRVVELYGEPMPAEIRDPALELAKTTNNRAVILYFLGEDYRDVEQFKTIYKAGALTAEDRRSILQRAAIMGWDSVASYVLEKEQELPQMDKISDAQLELAQTAAVNPETAGKCLLAMSSYRPQTDTAAKRDDFLAQAIALNDPASVLTILRHEQGLKASAEHFGAPFTMISQATLDSAAAKFATNAAIQAATGSLRTSSCSIQ